LTSIDNPQQATITIEVDYYDDNEKNALSKYSSSARITEVTSHILEIPLSEFLTYYLFHRKRPEKGGWINYQEISNNIEKALKDLEDFVEFNGKSLSIPSDVESQIPHITEYIGESVGLSVVNRIHNLTEADWVPIPKQSGMNAFKTFDYQIASDASDNIQVETKGSSVQDNRIKTTEIYTHKSKIKEKKGEIKKQEEDKSYPYPADIKYGTIVAIDYRQDGIVKCWLLDPTFDDYTASNPLNFKVINRIKFIRDWISFISPRSQLSSALSTRVKALLSLKDIHELNNVPLIGGNNEPFRPRILGIHERWFMNKSHVIDGPHVGIVLQLSRDRLFFLGIREELIEMAVEQNFDKVVKYRAEPVFLKKTVKCVISQGQFKKFELPPQLSNRVTRREQYVHFELQGILHFSPGGIVFGTLPLKWPEM